MQPSKPSFLEYFEQKEKEANSHQQAGEQGHNADNRKLPAEGDLEVVSSSGVGFLVAGMTSMSQKTEMMPRCISQTA